MNHQSSDCKAGSRPRVENCAEVLCYFLGTRTLLRRTRATFRKFMPARLDVNLPAAKLHALRLQQESLLQSQLAGKGNAAAGAEYSLPR